VQLLEPTRYRREHVLLWNRLPVQSFDPLKYRRYCFCDPALPLALASAVRFFLSRVWLALLSYQSTPLFEFGPSSRVLPSHTYPSRRSGSGPLMGFSSLQHMRHRRSTCRGVCPPATFRLQGLVTLLASYSLRSLAGSVSHRQRSWDSPFGGFSSRKVSGALPPG